MDTRVRGSGGRPVAAVATIVIAVAGTVVSCYITCVDLVGGTHFCFGAISCSELRAGAYSRVWSVPMA